MKVVVSGYVGKKITGIGRNLLGLLSCVSDENEYVIYTNFDMAKEFKSLPSNVLIKTYDVSKDDSLGNLKWTTFKLPTIAKKENADLLLIPNFTLLLRKTVPTVVIMHDLIEFNIPDKFSKTRMFYRTKLADPITAKNADKIITVSNNSKRDIMKFLAVPAEKIDVIYNGVDRERFTAVPEEGAREVLNEMNIEGNFLLYVGTIDHPGKNAYMLLKAFELLCDNGYDGKLVLAGMPGSGFEVIQQAIEASEYSDRVVLTGYVEDDQLPALYSSCDVFCFLSLYEGFGIPPLEAMSCGAKVLVSDRSSLPEVVGDCGATVDPQDPRMIAKAIAELMGADVDKEMLKRHLKEFDWKDLSEQFENALKSI